MTGATRAFTAYSLAELRALKFPDHAWVIDQLIPAGSLTLLVGRPKAGKSLLALDMLASVATGEPFIDRAVIQDLTIYGSAEDSLALVRQRLDERIGPDAEPELLVVPFDGSIDQWLRIDQHDSFGALARTVAELRPALMVLDPFREIHHQPENDADAMAAVLRPLRQLAHETNSAIVIVHHRNKYGADPSMAARGSSAIVGSVDQTITLDVPDGGDDSGESVPIGVLVEGRYGPRQRLSIQLGEGLRWSLVGEVYGSPDNPGRILAALQQRSDGFTAAGIAASTGLAERTALKHLTALHASGRIERHGEGNRWEPYSYRLTPASEPQCDGEQAAPQLRLVESIRTCQTCGGNLWREITRDTWRCAACHPPASPDPCPRCRRVRAWSGIGYRVSGGDGEG